MLGGKDGIVRIGIITLFKSFLHVEQELGMEKRGRASPRGRGSHRALPNGADGCTLEVRRN
jgi:hypothetical protein